MTLNETNMIKGSVKTRVVLGGVMILILIGLAALDVRFYREYAQTTPRGISMRPMVPVFAGWAAKGLILAALGVVLSALGVLEVAHLAGQTGAKPFPAVMVAGSILLVIQPFFWRLTLGLDAGAWISIFLIALMIAQMLRRETKRGHDQYRLVDLRDPLYRILHLLYHDPASAVWSRPRHSPDRGRKAFRCRGLCDGHGFRPA